LAGIAGPILDEAQGKGHRRRAVSRRTPDRPDMQEDLPERFHVLWGCGGDRGEPQFPVMDDASGF